MLDPTPSAANGYDASPQAVSGQGSDGLTSKGTTFIIYDLSTLDQHLGRIEADIEHFKNECAVQFAKQKWEVAGVQTQLEMLKADFAAYRRATDAKLADHHTELVQLRAEFRKLFDAVQHVGEPVFIPPTEDWIIDE